MAIKKIEKYLVAAPSAHKTSLESYAECPAHAFLVNVCDAHDSFVQCLKKFTKKADGQYNKDSEDSLRHISLAILGTVMGYFETFQKTLFAGVVERSAAFPSFDADKFLKHFEKHAGGDLVISPARLLAFRSTKAPVGLVMADSLSGWHNPSRVNSFFKAVGCQKDLFSGQDISDLEVLWQLRHSIVHTGGWLTAPDAQKVSRLKQFGNSAIAFDTNFVNAFARRFHRLLKGCNQRLLSDCIGLLGPSAEKDDEDDFKAFLAVKSPKMVWLN